MNPLDPESRIPTNPAPAPDHRDVAADPAPGDGRPDDEERGQDRRRLFLLGAGLLVILGALGWLFSGQAAPERMAIGDLPWVDGTLTIVEPTRLQMNTFEPLDGSTIIDFEILPRDQGAFDLAHIRTHSSLAIPTRIYFERSGDIYLAVYKTDAPLNMTRR